MNNIIVRRTLNEDVEKSESQQFDVDDQIGH